ncbi:MAG: aldehyde dehydrogenase family protein [Sphingomonadaceae bacterium]|nr:aldehyde dehydrogenase family protein [Sphingomonadaceae bacterium]
MASPDIEALPKSDFIIGKPVNSDGLQGYAHLYPANGEVTRKVSVAGKDEVDMAVRAARAALPGWRNTPPNERRKVMLRFAQLIRENGERFKKVINAENGALFHQLDWFVEWDADLFEYNAGYADKIAGEVVPIWPQQAFDYTLDEPYGVIGILVPWNGPSISFGQMIAPAMASGNVCIIKPTEFAPYSCLFLGELALEAGIPEGVINVIPGNVEAGEALTRHPGVDKLHFTGSGATARKILAGAAENMTPVGLELGGKSARLIFEDCDWQQAVMSVVGTCVGNAGQACIAGSRALVQESIYDKFLADCQAAAGHVKLGDPLAADTMMGPVIHEGHCNRILAMIDHAREEGGEILSGGKREGGDLASGFFVQPTLIADPDNKLEITREEVFGPVVSMIPFKDEEDAIRIANDTVYGLASYIDSTNINTVHRLASRLDAGNVMVNGAVGLPTAAPFGGHKQSGVGRVGGIWGIREFIRTKNVHIAM